MVTAAIQKAQEIGVLETVCVADEGGYPLLLERMDRGAPPLPQRLALRRHRRGAHRADPVRRGAHARGEPRAVRTSSEAAR